MKRIASLLTVLVLFLYLPCTTVLSSAENSGQNAVEVYWDGCEPAGEYVVFFLRDNTNCAEISADNVLFVDQIKASSNGIVNLLYLDPEFEACQIWLSGSFPDGTASPRLIGRYDASVAAAIHTPNALTEIEEEAFAGGAFTHVYLGDNVTSIGEKAFSGCSSLEYVEIPAMSVTIADDAFSGSPNVTIGCQAGSDAYNYAVEKGIPYRIIQY